MVSYIRVEGKPLNGQPYRELSASMQRIMSEEMTQAAIEGVAEAKGYIDIAGTQRIWDGWFKGGNGEWRSGPRRGRRDTDTMRNAVDYRLRRGGQNVQIEVGWVHPGDYQDYFQAQDQGFSAGGFRPSQTVEGMHMLAHLRTYMRDRVDMAVDRATDRMFDGL